MIVKERENFLGINIDPLTMDETLSKISSIVEKKVITQHVVINVAKLVYAHKNKMLMEIINSCGLINVDGAGIVLGAKLLGINIPERVAGIDLMENLVEYSSKKGYKIYFFGAEENIVQKVVDVYSEKYPNLEIAGYRNGYYTKQEEPLIAQTIKDSAADILFVAMGSPQKELFLNKYLEFMEVPFVMGVGGSFDVVAGKVERAPIWIQKAGFEWLYRLMQEPGRLWRRYLTTNTLFMLMILQAFFVRRKDFLI